MIGMEKLLKKSIDLHVHVGPEPILRRYGVKTLAMAVEGKLAGVCAKRHFSSTAEEVAKLEGKFNLQLFGSLVLNSQVGGLKPQLIYKNAALVKNPLVVWFPTISAQNFLNQSKYEIPPEWVERKDFKPRLSSEAEGISVIDSRGVVTADASACLKAIAETGSILATGHISWKESKALVEEAVRLGVTRIIVTHPIYQKIAMPLEVQRELAALGAFIEQSYAMYSIDKIPIEKIARNIRKIGADRTILSSDVGQITGPSPDEALKDFCMELTKVGISRRELETMLVVNPRKLA